MVESEIKHLDSAIELLDNFLSGFDNQGFYLFKNRLHTISGFCPDMQDAKNFHTGNWGAAREYVNNFIFMQTTKATGFIKNLEI